MGTSIGPSAAIGGLFEGLAEGIAQNRQKKLEQEAKTERDREFGLRKLEAEAAQTRANVEAGLQPANSLDLRPEDASPVGGPAGKTVDPRLTITEQGPFSALLNSFTRTQQQPRVTVPDIATGQNVLMRVGETPADRRNRLTQNAAMAREDAKAAAALVRQEAAEAQKAKDAAAKVAKDEEDARLTLADYTNDPAWRGDFAVKAAAKAGPNTAGKWTLSLNNFLARKKAKEDRENTALLRPPETKLVPVEQADGSVTYMRPEDAVGKKVGKTAGAAKTTATNAMLNRQKDYVALMAGALPKMKALVGSVEPWKVSLAEHQPIVANSLMTPNQRQYMLNLRSFLAGVLHEESGARLSDKQVEWGLLRYAPMFGDDPKTVADKQAAAEDVVRQRAQNAGYVPSDAPLSASARKEVEALQSQPAGSGGKGGGVGTVPSYEEWKKANGIP